MPNFRIHFRLRQWKNYWNRSRTDRFQKFLTPKINSHTSQHVLKQSSYESSDVSRGMVGWIKSMDLIDIDLID